MLNWILQAVAENAEKSAQDRKHLTRSITAQPIYGETANKERSITAYSLSCGGKPAWTTVPLSIYGWF